jgi:hypothetical protein
MAQPGQRKCLCCDLFFDPDPRNRERQRYCSTAHCRRASKAASHAAWLTQPDNVGYFRGPVHVARVQAWRAAHTGYGRGRRRAPRALQDSLMAQVPDSTEQSSNRGETAVAPTAPALQESLTPLAPALAGLIAHLFDVTLQEDMDATTRRLVQLGHDVIKRSRGEASQAGGDQTTAATRAAAPGASAVQLG